MWFQTSIVNVYGQVYIITLGSRLEFKWTKRNAMAPRLLGAQPSVQGRAHVDDS